MRPLALLALALACPVAADDFESAAAVPAVKFTQTTSKAAIEALVAEQVAAHYPRLAKVKVVVEDDLVSDFDFMQADVKGVMRDWDSRIYVVKISQKLYANSPGDKALRGILTHEIGHLDDYAHRSTFGLAGLGWDYAFTDDNDDVIAYEKSIDEKALRFGYGEGIKAYRIWLYAQLTPEKAAKKRRTYYTPEQIDEWMRAHP